MVGVGGWKRGLLVLGGIVFVGVLCDWYNNKEGWEIDRSHKRYNASPKLMNKSPPSSGPKVETKTCTPDCVKPPVDCVLSDWSEWSTCDKPCGGGQTTRTRKVVTELAFNGKPCDGLLKETKACNLSDCEEPVGCFETGDGLLESIFCWFF